MSAIALEMTVTTAAAARTVAATKVYGKGQVEVRALGGVSVKFAARGYTAIMGPSGSGKSDPASPAALASTPARLRSSNRWQAVIIALQGTLLGLLIGVFFGWALVTALGHPGRVVFSLPT
jgi:hypothetical protein